MEAEPVEHALVTFTTGSTGMPKLLLRKHSFLTNQSQALSMSFDMVIKKELEMEEEDAVFCTNLSVFPLHFLRVKGGVVHRLRGGGVIHKGCDA